MGKKFMRKFKVVMMGLVILILVGVGVQANDLTSTSFHPSSLQTPQPYTFELNNMDSEFFICLEHHMETYNLIKVDLDNDMINVIWNFAFYMGKIHPHDPMHHKVIDANLLCIKKYGRHKFDVGNCSIQWYEEHRNKNDRDVFHMQIP